MKTKLIIALLIISPSLFSQVFILTKPIGLDVGTAVNIKIHPKIGVYGYSLYSHNQLDEFNNVTWKNGVGLSFAIKNEDETVSKSYLMININNSKGDPEKFGGIFTNYSFEIGGYKEFMIPDNKRFLFMRSIYVIALVNPVDLSTSFGFSFGF